MNRPNSNTLSAHVCQRLDYWYEVKRQSHRGTTDLMRSSDNVQDRKIISVVALLDIDPTILASIAGPDELEFITHCHRYLAERFHLQPSASSSSEVLAGFAKCLS